MIDLSATRLLRMKLRLGGVVRSPIWTVRHRNYRLLFLTPDSRYWLGIFSYLVMTTHSDPVTAQPGSAPFFGKGRVDHHPLGVNRKVGSFHMSRQARVLEVIFFWCTVLTAFGSVAATAMEWLVFLRYRLGLHLVQLLAGAYDPVYVWPCNRRGWPATSAQMGKRCPPRLLHLHTCGIRGFDNS